MTSGDPHFISITAAMKARGWAIAHRPALVIAAVLIFFGLVLWQISPPAGIRPPLPTDLPFDTFVGLRQFVLAQAGNSIPILASMGAAIIVLIWLIALPKGRVRQAISATIVVACALIALQAQVDLMSGRQAEGTALYLVAAAIFFTWCIVSRSTSQPPNGPASQRIGYPTNSVSRRVELILLTVVLGVSVFARIYELKRMPYGVDGDESKWTIEVVSTVVDGRDILSSEYHRRQLPMSFLMEAPFQWIMGAGLTPGRVGAAVYSIVASFVFYLLVRRLYDPPIALVATLLLAVSLPDITASRAGNVESYVRLWTALPLLGLAVALDTRELKHFLLTGVAVAGAMITYETLMPTVAATLTLALAAALREWRDWRMWLRRLAAMATAPAAVAIVTIDYLLGRIQYYQGYRSAAESYPLDEQLLRGVQGLLQPFYYGPLNDALFNRQGPYINGLLVPLLVLGIVYTIAHARRRGNAIALTWLAWAFIPIPIILHTPLPRILYPGVPVLYLLAAVAFVTIYRAISHAVQVPSLSASLGVLALTGFAVLNLTIWFQEIQDTPDEIRRRQVAEIVASTVDPSNLLLMPHFPFGETVEIERDLIDLTIRERHRATGTGDTRGEYRVVLFEDLLHTLSLEGGAYPRATVLYDLLRTEMAERRQAIISTMLRCYPTTQVEPAEYFDIYQIAGGDLAHPSCISTRLSITPPQRIINGGMATRIDIGWSLESASALQAASASQSMLVCSRSRNGIVWVEAESMGELRGWIADTQFVTGWSGTGYLADDPGSEFAATTIDVPQPGVYQVWVRSFRRQEDGFPAFIEIGGKTLVYGEPDPGILNTWRWQALDDVVSEAGQIAIRLTRPFDNSRTVFIALFTDAIVLSPDPNFDPGRDERWQPVLELRGPDQTSQASGVFETRFEPGSYRCEITVADGDRLIDESGAVGITSDPIYFEVKP
jgi:hypothetical protein